MRDLLYKGLAAAGVLVLFFVLAPLTVRLGAWLTDDTPPPAAVCAHLAELGADNPDCEADVQAIVDRYDGVAEERGSEVGRRFLGCLGDARDEQEIAECDDPSYVYGYDRARRERERAAQ
jgi:hypothetical protein